MHEIIYLARPWTYPKLGKILPQPKSYHGKNQLLKMAENPTITRAQASAEDQEGILEKAFVRYSKLLEMHCGT